MNFATNALAAVGRRIDPVDDRQSLRAAPSVDDLLKRYLAEHVDVHNAPKTAESARLSIEKHIRPRFGEVRAASGSHLAIPFCVPARESAFSAPLGGEMRALGRLIRLAIVGMAILWPIAGAQACSGCGCRGGPGYRGPNGRCVGWADIGRTCGDPPSTRCTPEGPNAGAEEAAKLGAKAIEAGKQKPGGPK